MSGLCTDCGGPDYQTLEARIDELEALVVKVEQQRNTMTAERDDLMADSKKLEAHLHIVTGERNRYLDRHEDAEAENERLRDARASDALFAEKKVNQAEAALAERDKESIALLDAVFQTVDPEDGEEIVAEAFPKGGPAWVLAWYQEHPNEEELRVRAAPYPKHVCYLCHSPIQPDQESEEWEPGYRHFECPVRAEEGSENE